MDESPLLVNRIMISPDSSDDALVMIHISIIKNGLKYDTNLSLSLSLSLTHTQNGQKVIHVSNLTRDSSIH